MIWLIAASVADFVTTMLVLRAGGREINPIADALIKASPFLWFVLKIGAAWAVYVLTPQYVYIAVGALFAISGWNLALWRRLK